RESVRELDVAGNAARRSAEERYLEEIGDIRLRARHGDVIDVVAVRRDAETEVVARHGRRDARERAGRDLPDPQRLLIPSAHRVHEILAVRLDRSGHDPAAV